MLKKIHINYIYFASIFLVLMSLHLFHLYLVSAAEWKVFCPLVIGQAALEISAFVILSPLFLKTKGRLLPSFFIIISFCLLVLHLIDFPLVRLMDMSIWYVLDFVFLESFENFIEILRLSNIKLISWAVFLLLIVVSSWSAIQFFCLSEKISLRRPFSISYRFLILSCSVLVISLGIYDYRITQSLDPWVHDKIAQALPLKTTFFGSSYPVYKLKGKLLTKKKEAWFQQQLHQLELSTVKKPNIYLFIAESLRADFLTPSVAPTLSLFREEHFSLPLSISSANATHPSWFSLFHSVYPFEWSKRQPSQWSIGSIPLNLLKKAGYQIHVLSASRFSYYQMDHMLFGKEHCLVDDYYVVADLSQNASHVYDAACIDRLIDTMASKHEGHVFLVFLEATHFDYSWPEHLKLPYHPALSTIDYWRATYSRSHVEGIKNRYRHAIHHIDHQFSRFLNALKKHPQGEDAIVVFTSDHGEEFYEEDRLFHASNLNAVQTTIPIYYKLGKETLSLPSYTVTSHLDIFPTILDHVFQLNGIQTTCLNHDWFDGESLLQRKERNFALSSRYNASRSPYEFLITTASDKVAFRLRNKKHIFRSKKVEMIGRKNSLRERHVSSEEYEQFYLPILNYLFSKP